MSELGGKGSVLQKRLSQCVCWLHKVLPPARSTASQRSEGDPLTLAFPDCSFFAWTLLFVFGLIASSATEQGCSVAPSLIFPPSHNSGVYFFYFVLLLHSRRRNFCPRAICIPTSDGAGMALVRAWGGILLLVPAD